MASRSLRILCLHGYTRSAGAFSQHIAPLTKSLDGIAQLDFLDGTFAAAASDPTSSSPHEREGDPMDECVRMWWRQRTGDYAGADETLARIAGTLATADPPYDGVLGFSAGACLAILLAALSCDSTLVPAFEDGLEGRTIAPFRFAIICSGYSSTDPKHLPCYAQPIEVPSMHIIGLHDAICWPAWSEAASEHFVRPRVHYHPGCHHFPGGPVWRHRLVEFIKLFTEDDLSPQGSVSSISDLA